MTMNTAAADLRVGDVVQISADAAWRIKSIEVSAATVNVIGTYTRCDFSPARVGTDWSHRYRASTKLEVIR